MGIEPTTVWLQIKLAKALEHVTPYCVERVKGVEPSSPGWKPGVMSITLPLYDTREFYILVGWF